MTRKDYILIASALRIARKDAPELAVLELHKELTLHGVNVAVERIADAIKASNPAFDREHFLAVVRGEKEVNSKPEGKKS